MNRFKMIKKELQPLFKAYKGRIVFAYLFGTAASHDYSPLSDIDLAFYVDSQEDAFDLKLALYTDCTRLLKRNDIDVIILNNLRNLILADEIVTNGTVIFDSNPEVRLDYEVRIHHQALDFMHQRKMIIGV
ncbi:MAG: nucleotidyltransferase domain-containing protein [Candidatus Marinimicrobia bacterium]|nr:nucleotidyltransferase domain-containing protein [Candidatus Neomarinimicrobiota bacterium]